MWPRIFLFPIAGDAHDKLCIAGFRAEPDDAAELIDDALYDAETDTGADADWLGGIERIEDMRLAVQRNTDAVVAYANAEIGAPIVGVA